MKTSEPPTGPTVLNVVARPGDNEAWERLVLRYGPLIQSWCRRWHLQPADAEEVIQKVLLKLFRHIAHFERQRNGSFRAYLKTVARHAVCDVLKDKKSMGQTLADDRTACDEFLENLDREFDNEFLEEAMERVKTRVEDKTWQAFWLCAHEDLAGQEVAQRLRISRAAVYMAKSRVAKMLQEEMARLEKEGR